MPGSYTLIWDNSYSSFFKKVYIRCRLFASIINSGNIVITTPLQLLKSELLLLLKSISISGFTLQSWLHTSSCRGSGASSISHWSWRLITLNYFTTTVQDHLFSSLIFLFTTKLHSWLFIHVESALSINQKSFIYFPLERFVIHIKKSLLKWMHHGWVVAE